MLIAIFESHQHFRSWVFLKSEECVLSAPLPTCLSHSRTGFHRATAPGSTPAVLQSSQKCVRTSTTLRVIQHEAHNEG